MIEVQSLTKRYGPVTAVNDVSFRVERGEILGFLGPNGAGKTTTMRVLTGYMPPSEGKAIVAGYDVFERPLEAKRRTGYLPETPPLYPDMTPYALLSFFTDARGLSTARREERIDAVIGICRLETVVHKPIGKLSKGYRQRVGMAQSLLHEPDVLIMHEPTAGLDPNQIRGVRDVLGALSATKTILLSTHILQEVEAMASRVVMINEGRMVYDGPVAGLDPDKQGLEEAFHRLTAVQAAVS